MLTSRVSCPILSLNSIDEDPRPLRAPAQDELRQRDGVPAEEAAEAGGAAAEEDEGAERKRQQEGQDRDDSDTIILLNGRAEDGCFPL